MDAKNELQKIVGEIILLTEKFKAKKVILVLLIKKLMNTVLKQ